MSRCLLIAELATNHGGDMSLAKEMIAQAADAGADIVKTQGYLIKNLRRSDPQYAWFKQCELSDRQHQELMAECDRNNVRYLTTAYCEDDLGRLRGLGLASIKIGSGEGMALAVAAESFGFGFATIYVSLAWGKIGYVRTAERSVLLATVPLYPAPPETYAIIEPRQGYSDHHVGLDVAKIAIARGEQVFEKHFQIDGRGRNQAWNMNATDLRELRRWAEVCAQARDGTAFEGRWQQP